MMRYAVIGMGAVGGYYGSRLFAAGRDVHFLARSDYDYVKEHGLWVDSYLGAYQAENMNVYDDVRKMPACDVVIVAMKTTQNHLLPRLLPPLIKENTLVVMMQNGIGVEADVERMLPGVKLAAGVVFINCVKDGPGRLIHKGFGHLALADFNCGDKQRLLAVAEDFRGAMVPTQITEYYETRWRKNILNMATNGMTVKYRCQCDELVLDPTMREEVRGLLMEGIAAARACGVEAIGEELADQLLETTGKTHFATSMRYDFDHGLPMEIEYMYSRPIAEALRKGCDVPMLRELEQLLICKGVTGYSLRS